MGHPIAIDAEVQNAEPSTGPVPPEAQTPRDDDRDREAFEARKAEWRAQYEVATPEQEWLLEQMVLYAIRLDRCRAQESALRRHEQQRARLRWDEARRAEAEELGSGLARKPDLIASRLRQTRQGAEWLLDRWRLLGQLLEGGGPWTKGQIAMALDLSGTPRALRPKVPVVADPAALVAREIAALERQKARSLDALDEQERQAAERGEPIATPTALVELRREEDALRRLFLWARRQLQSKARAKAPAPPSMPLPAAPPAAAERPPAEPAPAPAPKSPVKPPHMSNEEWIRHQARLALEMRRRWNSAP